MNTNKEKLDILDLIEDVRLYDDKGYPYHSSIAKYHMEKLEEYFKNASFNTRNDKNLVLKTIKENLDCAKFISEALKNDKDIIETIIKTFQNYPIEKNFNLETLKNNPEQLFELLEQITFKDKERYRQKLNFNEITGDYKPITIQEEIYTIDETPFNSTNLKIENPTIKEMPNIEKETKIQNVEIDIVTDMDPIKAIASIVVNDRYIEGIKIRDDGNGIWVQMPQEKNIDDTYKDMLLPITQEERKATFQTIIKAYEDTIATQIETEDENNLGSFGL